MRPIVRASGSTVALAGSGEFSETLRPIDACLAAPEDRIVLITAASAPDGPVVHESSTQRACEHFGSMGREFVTPVVSTPESAADPTVSTLVSEADLIWLYGGDPLWLRRCLEPLEPAIGKALARGARIAGSSAGAMVLGPCTLPRLECEPAWHPALGVVQAAVTIPHLDVQPADRLARMLERAPTGRLVLGIDERTVLLVRRGFPSAEGVGGVTVFRGGEPIGCFERAPSLTRVVDRLPPRRGPIGLLSGDEFTPHAEAFDRAMLGASGPRVALLLCADPNTAGAQARLAVDHLGPLGATPFVVDALDREAAMATTLPEYDLLYIGGGSPATLMGALAETPLWHEVLRRWQSGAGIAGSSAGAMALCRSTLLPEPGADLPTKWGAGLGPLEHVAIAAHAASRPAEWLDTITATAPVPVLALDDATGVVLADGAEPRVIGPGSAWVVSRYHANPTAS